MEDYPKDLTVIPREEWGAKPPRRTEEDPLLPLRTPVSWVHFNDTNTSMCDSQEHCSRTVRYIQDNHQDGGWPDITHNFLIGTSGEVYVGRGWDYQPHGIQLEMIQDAIDIAFIGNFERLSPHPTMMQSAESLVSYGVMTGKVNVCNGVRWFREYMDTGY